MAPVGGTIWAASPARNSRPYCIGSATKLRMPRDALLEDRPLGQRRSRRCAEPRLQLLPDALVGPLVEVLVGGALQVEPARARRAHAEQREAALVVGVDQLVGRGRRLGQDAEPGERIDALVDSCSAPAGIAGAADAVEAVAAGDEVAVQLAASRRRA